MRIVDPAFLEPFERGVQVGQRLDGSERLRHGDDQRRGGIEPADRLVECLAVDVGEDADVVAVSVAAQGVDDEVGAERRAADADVEDRLDLTERAALDRVD